MMVPGTGLTIAIIATTSEPGSASMTPAKTLSVVATWEGGYRCKVATGAFEIAVDEPVSAGGDGTGPQPTEVFLASLASCFALALSHVARKREVELADLTVTAVGEYDGPKFAKLRLEVVSSLAAELLEPLLARASAICYVSNTLRAVNEVEVVLANYPAQQ